MVAGGAEPVPDPRVELGDLRWLHGDVWRARSEGRTRTPCRRRGEAAALLKQAVLVRTLLLVVVAIIRRTQSSRYRARRDPTPDRQ